ncbi:heavy metal response regulator transcription factor [bacterium]|nr:heavy metal response regulator transcription factor [bacterium]
MRILVVEDEPRLASFLANGLRENGYAVDIAADGEEGMHLGRSGIYDVILLDILLPRQSGFEVLRQLRQAGVETPVLCLTACDQPEDKVRGLDLGADDYLAKPFNFAELLARVRALLRRAPGVAPTTLRCDDLELDPATRRVTRADREIDLTPREHALLEFLMRRAGSVCTRTAILEAVWDMNFDSLTNVLDVLVNRLRAKVDYPFGRRLIHTVRSVGYVLSEEPQ